MERVPLLIENKIIQKRKGKPLAYEEKIEFNRCIRKLDFNKYKTHRLDEVVEVLSDVLLEELKKVYVEDHSAVDIHELMKSQIALPGDNSTAAVAKGKTIDDLLQTPFTLQRIFNPDVTKRSVYLNLDSRHRVPNDSDTKLFKWNIATIGMGITDDTYALTCLPLTNIVSMIMTPFKMPYIPRALTDQHRLSVEIVEFDQQAYIASNNHRYHFLFQINQTTDGYSTFTTDNIDQNRAEFKFSHPIAELTTITLRFGNPENYLTPTVDNLTANIYWSGTQTLFDFGFGNAHYCEIGDLVYITGYNTTDTVNDSYLISLVNSSTGWPIYSTTAFTLSINIDTSSQSGATVGPVKVYLNSKRFMLNLEFICMSDDRSVPLPH
jgi:hypothetical protein